MWVPLYQCPLGTLVFASCLARAVHRHQEAQVSCAGLEKEAGKKGRELRLGVGGVGARTLSWFVRSRSCVDQLLELARGQFEVGERFDHLQQPRDQEKSHLLHARQQRR